tara:strand:- start:1432 stop:2547 length:1116 start_codon:yes stop_codon:yes gene_type:complete
MATQGDFRARFAAALLEKQDVSNVALQNAIDTAGKTDSFLFFKQAMRDAGPAIEGAVFPFLNSLKAGDIVDFVKGLHSEKKITGHKVATKGVGHSLFRLKPVGIGRGEVYCAWLYKDAFIQGGNESFDVQQGKVKYEVKEYTGGNKSSAIRVGVEGSVSKFGFWKEILKTVDTIQEIQGTDGSSWDLLPKGPELEALKKLKDDIIARVEEEVKIVTGEFGKKDLKRFVDFYTSADRVVKSFETTGDYNQIVLRGPNQKPKSIIIDPISAAEVPSAPSDLSVKVMNAKGDATTETIINFLKRLKYLRTPSQFLTDIDSDIATLLSKGEADNWIIYRGKSDAPIQKVYTRAEAVKTFKFETISQNGVKFKEPK